LDYVLVFKMNYNGKKFKTVSNSDNGETSSDTIFFYQQEGNIVTSSCKGGKIISGHLIGIVDGEGVIDMRYLTAILGNNIEVGTN